MTFWAGASHGTSSAKRHSKSRHVDDSWQMASGHVGDRPDPKGVPALVARSKHVLAINSAENLTCIAGGAALRFLQLDRALLRGEVCECAGTVRCLAFNHMGSMLLSGDDSKRVRLWNTATFACVPEWLHHKKIGCVAFSPCGAHGLWADRFGEVYVVRIADGAAAAPSIALGHLSPVSHLKFAPSGEYLLTADREGHVRSRCACAPRVEIAPQGAQRRVTRLSERARRSCWPHADIIESYYLRHKTPLQIVFPLASAPLLLTATSDGNEVCVWSFKDATLVEEVTGAALLGEFGEFGPSADASDARPLEAACECTCREALVALGFRATPAVFFSRLTWSATQTGRALTPVPDLTLRLDGAPDALVTAHDGSLCVLAAHRVHVFSKRDDGRFASAAGRIVSVGEVLPMAPKAALGDSDDDDGDD